MNVPPLRSDLTILIAEDDDGHAELIQEQLEESGITHPTRRFRDGEECWAFLREEVIHSRKCYLLLLDLRMPAVDGFEVLRRIKGDPGLKKMPVIILSTTDDPGDVESCYRQGANLYITKPSRFAHFSKALQRVGELIDILKLPRIGDQAVELPC